MRVRGQSGALFISGKELARLGKYEFERSPGELSVSITAELVSVDRFIARHIGAAPVTARLDFQSSRTRTVQNLSFGEKQADFSLVWSEGAEVEATGTHG